MNDPKPTKMTPINDRRLTDPLMSRHVAIGIRAMEECNELAQRISKALLFGMTECEPAQQFTNTERIYQEFWDLRAVLGMFGIDAWANDARSAMHERAKAEKVDRFMDYARARGEQFDELKALNPEAGDDESITARDAEQLLQMFDHASELMEAEHYERLNRFLKRAIKREQEGKN